MPPKSVKVYPNSDLNIFNLTHWINIVHDETATELWIDSNIHRPLNFQHDIFRGVTSVVFYDFFHAHAQLSSVTLENICKTSEKYPTRWYTGNAKQIAGIQCVRFDHMWNRTKQAISQAGTGWKCHGDVAVYKRAPLHWNYRTKKYLNLNRSFRDYRIKLFNFLQNFDGYSSNLKINQVLGHSLAIDDQIKFGMWIPPDSSFFDDSYISCQVESQFDGSESVIFSEKTYDHLLRGRVVLNFGPKDFYSCLEKDGWCLPKNVDLSWDSEPDADTRFNAYLATLESILSMSGSDLHDWFLENRSVIEHNYHMLEIKPYDTIN